MFDPLQINLKSCGFFSLAVVQLELGLDGSCTGCTDLPVARGGFEFSPGHAGKQGAGRKELWKSVFQCACWCRRANVAFT